MAQSYCNLLYHIVYSTKERRPWLDDADLRTRVHNYIGGAVHGEGGIPLLIGGACDHVHIFAKLRQDTAVSKVIGAIKANTSGWVHDTFSGLTDFYWQAGYGAFTVSPSQVEKVRRYMLNQEGHHKTVSFQDEFVALLKAHGIEYDPRYIWS